MAKRRSWTLPVGEAEISLFVSFLGVVVKTTVREGKELTKRSSLLCSCEGSYPARIRTNFLVILLHVSAIGRECTAGHGLTPGSGGVAVLVLEMGEHVGMGRSEAGLIV